jgi:hypothetical protein
VYSVLQLAAATSALSFCAESTCTLSSSLAVRLRTSSSMKSAVLRPVGRCEPNPSTRLRIHRESLRGERLEPQGKRCTVYTPPSWPSGWRASSTDAPRLDVVGKRDLAGGSVPGGS